MESSDIKDELKKEDVFLELDEASDKYKVHFTKFCKDMILGDSWILSLKLISGQQFQWSSK